MARIVSEFLTLARENENIMKFKKKWSEFDPKIELELNVYNSCIN